MVRLWDYRVRDWGDPGGSETRFTASVAQLVGEADGNPNSGELMPAIL
jgi:hypothetical protein